MQIELRCPCCRCAFSEEPDAPSVHVLDRMIEEGPWFALADGETFEDMVFNALLLRGRICCPECGEPVHVSERSLGQMARDLFPCA